MKHSPRQMNPNRRDWFRLLGRSALLIALGAVGALATRGTRHASEGGPCAVQSPCQTCGIWNRCGFPRAAAARTAAEGGNHGR